MGRVPLRTLPFGNHTANVFSRADDAYNFLVKSACPVSDFRAKNNEFRFRASKLILPELSVFASSSDPLDIRHHANPVDVVIAFLLQGRAEARAEGIKCEWSPRREVLYQFRDGDHRFNFKTERSVVFLATTESGYRLTFRSMFRESSESRKEYQPNGSYMRAASRREHELISLLLPTLALSDLPGVTEEHLERIGFEDVIQRLIVEMTVARFFATDELLPTHRIKRSHKALDVICDTVATRIEKPVTLTEMEEMTGMSRRSLHNAFMERFNCSPQEWQRNYRLDLAHSHLSKDREDFSIKTICWKYGFLSPVSFAQFYRRRFGELPSETLRKNRSRRSQS